MIIFGVPIYLSAGFHCDNQGVVIIDVDPSIYTREYPHIYIWGSGNSQLNRGLVINTCLLISSHKLSTLTLPLQWCSYIYVLNYRLLLRRPSTLFLPLACNLAVIMTPKDVLATITAARDNFVPISGKPIDGNLLRLRECLIPILLTIRYNTDG